MERHAVSPGDSMPAADGCKRLFASLAYSARWSLFQRFDWFRTTGFSPDYPAAVFALFLAEVLTELCEVVVEPREELLPRQPCLLDDRVFPHGRHPSISSCGVQMTGGS